MPSHLDAQRTGAGRYRTRAWVAGYLAQMDGLGEECPHKPNSAEAIDWTDGHGQALKSLRYLPDDYLAE
jgi:hypothetical protein